VNSQLIISLIQLILTEGPVAVEEIIKLKAMLTQSPDIAANLKSLFDSANTDDLAVISRANAWLAAHGQPLVQVPGQ